MQFRILATSALAAALAVGCASQQKAETAKAPEPAAVSAPAKAAPAKPKL